MTYMLMVQDRALTRDAAAVLAAASLLPASLGERGRGPRQAARCAG